MLNVVNIANCGSGTPTHPHSLFDPGRKREHPQANFSTLLSNGVPTRLGSGAAAVLAVMLLVVGLLLSWRRRPELTRRAEARSRARMCRHAENATQQRVQALERQRADGLANESDELRRLARRRTEIEVEEQRPVSRASGARNREIKRIDAESQALVEKEQGENTGAPL